MPRISTLLLAAFLGKVGALIPLQLPSTGLQCQVGIKFCGPWKRVVREKICLKTKGS